MTSSGASVPYDADPGERPGDAGAGRLDLERQLLNQRDSSAPASPLYGRVLDAVLADLMSGGVSARLLEPWAGIPPSEALGLRFLAAVHRLALEGRAPALAAHYPSTGGVPGPSLERDLIDTLHAHEQEVARRLSEPVQTNEVGRAASMIGGHLTVAAATGLPLRVLELGASAGLNLRFDRFAYLAGGEIAGDADSPVRFVEPWGHGPVPDLSAPFEVVTRRGCDSHPIDPTTDEGRTRLRSLVWPDQTDRLARLDAAIEVARAVPATVDRARAADWLAEQLAEEHPGVATVVTHSIVMQYLSDQERTQVVALLRRAGARADDRSPLAWLRLEPGGSVAEVRLTLWPGGERRVLATSAFHGPPVSWRS